MLDLKTVILRKLSKQTLAPFYIIRSSNSTNDTSDLLTFFDELLSEILQTQKKIDKDLADV